MYGKSNMDTYITMCKIDSQREFAVWLRKLKQGLSISLEGWDGEGDGREVQRGGEYVYLWLVQVEVWQKTTKFCMAIILQLKKKKNLEGPCPSPCLKLSIPAMAGSLQGQCCGKGHRAGLNPGPAFLLPRWSPSTFTAGFARLGPQTPFLQGKAVWSLGLPSCSVWIGEGPAPMSPCSPSILSLSWNLWGAQFDNHWFLPRLASAGWVNRPGDWVPPRGCVVPGGPPSSCSSLGLILPPGGGLVMAPVHPSCLLDHLLQMHLGPWGCKNPLLLILEEERKKCKKEEIIKTV